MKRSKFRLDLCDEKKVSSSATIIICWQSFVLERPETNQADIGDNRHDPD